MRVDINKSKRVLFIFLLFISALICSNSVCADTSFIGENLTTIDEGTVTGGLYSDTYYGYDSKGINIDYSDTIASDSKVDNTSDQFDQSDYEENYLDNLEVSFEDKNVTYVFAPLSDNITEVNSAHLVIGVYIGNMHTDYPIDCYVSFNGHILCNERLSSTYDDSGVVYLNSNISRVTSDYVFHYDVKDDISTNANVVKIVLSNSGLAVVKMASLIVSYNDSDYDEYKYIINLGHDVANEDGYVGTTKFEPVNSGVIVNDAKLNVYYLASVNGVYQFNNNTLEYTSPQAGYSGISTWDVTDYYKIGYENQLDYHRMGSYYKIILSTLLVDYSTIANLPDLIVEDVTVNQNYSKYNGHLLADMPNNISVKIRNIGLLNAKAFNVTLSIGDNVYTKEVENLEGKKSTTLYFTDDLNLDVGYSIINITLDSNVINEFDSTNNNYTEQLSVINGRYSDLNISSLKIEGNHSYNTEDVISFIITNEGYSHSNSAVLTVYADMLDDSTLLKNITIPVLEINETYNVSFVWVPSSHGTYTIRINLTQNGDDLEVEYDDNVIEESIIVTNPNKLLLFIISDNSGVNSYNQATKEILEYYGDKVLIQIRTNNQIAEMSNNELLSYLQSCDIFIGDWLSSSVSETINSFLLSNKSVFNNKPNKIFLMLEPAASTTASLVDLMKYSFFNVKGNDLILSINDISQADLLNYYSNTTRGLSYSNVKPYISSNNNIPQLFNKAQLYKVMNTVDSHKNMMLWLLNSFDSKTYVKSYNNPPETLNEPNYGIYREKWYSYLDDDGNWCSGIEKYLDDYFVPGQPSVGILESTMYVDSQQLQTYYSIIKSLEDLGINVIPIVAYGATTEQLDVMFKSFTNGSNITDFINNPSNYEVRIDALINMVAYGLGGTNFASVSPFFEALNVPILKAVHSDYISNIEYQLGSTGLGTLTGDKWWHITISEAQGSITPIFVGGYGYDMDSITGASISGYVPYEGNINLLANSVYNWILLKKLSNSDKKVSLIYYNYPPGKQNVGASYLDPVESIYNLLHILKDNGYDVKNIPSNSTILMAQILSQGTNVANWANGLVEVMADFSESSYNEIYGYQVNNTYQLNLSALTDEDINSLLNTPGVILYSVDEFKQWYNKLDDINKLTIEEGPIAYIGAMCKKAVINNYKNYTDEISSWYKGVINLIPLNMNSVALPLIDNIANTLKQYVLTGNESYYDLYLEYKEEFLSLNISGLSGWGEFPGNIMVVERNDTKYFVLPGIQYGNVFIGPEPQRGWEGNSEQLYHNSIVPPHYQYLAFYAYLQEKKYNSMVFIGRHATHEWMSGKEVMEDCNDFTTVLTGAIPQIYFYEVDGVSEGLTAKRRGYAVIIDHLTPPMTFTSLYGNLSTLNILLEQYDDPNDENDKGELLQQIRKIIVDNEYDRDMGVVVDLLSDEELITQTYQYLEEIVGTMYPCGLHVLGETWSDYEVALLTTSMLSVDFEYNNAGETTNLFEELSLITYNKSYSQLISLQQSIIQDKAVELMKQLIALNNSEDVIKININGSPSEGLIKTFELAKKYIESIQYSTTNEINAFLNALNCGYILPGTGNDPVNNPQSLPTGKNFYEDQSTEIPTQKAYNKSIELLDLSLSTINDTTKKIVVGIWDTETARDNGELISMVLRLLGVKPEWTSSPSAGVDGKKLKETPAYIELEDIERPEGFSGKRIDVVVILDGNFRDLYSRQVGLMDKAFRVALSRSYYTIINNEVLKEAYGENLTLAIDPIMESIGYYGASNESFEDNYVAYDWAIDFIHYMDLGYDAKTAGEYAINRIFAPPENDYGALISQAVRQSWTFNDSEDLAQKYLNRMGYIYSSNSWGEYNSEVLKTVLTGTNTLLTSRNTNLYGVIDNDDYFDYWGGLYNLMMYLNKDTISFNILRYGNAEEATSYDLTKYLSRELNSRYFNPSWIIGMMNESYAGAGYMSRFVSNLYGWQWTASDTITNNMWDTVVDVYVNDRYDIGVTNFLTTGYNSYAMISITGTLLTTAYDGFWKTDESTLKKVANMWGQLIVDNGVACCDCSCGNILMMDWTLNYINPDILSQLKMKLYQATQDKTFFEDGYSSNPNSNGSVNGTGETGSDGEEGYDADGNSTGGNGTSGSSTGGNGTTVNDGNSTGNGTSTNPNNSGNQTTVSNITDTDNNQNNTPINNTSSINETNLNDTSVGGETSSNSTLNGTDLTNQTSEDVSVNQTVDNNTVVNDTSVGDESSSNSTLNGTDLTNQTSGDVSVNQTVVNDTNHNSTLNDTSVGDESSSNSTLDDTNSTNQTSMDDSVNQTVVNETVVNNTVVNDTSVGDESSSNSTLDDTNSTNQTSVDDSVNQTVENSTVINDTDTDTNNFNSTNTTITNNTNTNSDIKTNSSQNNMDNGDVGNKDESASSDINAQTNVDSGTEDNKDESVSPQDVTQSSELPSTSNEESISTITISNSPATSKSIAVMQATSMKSDEKIFELNKATKGSAITESEASIIAVIFILAIIGFISYGYIKRDN